MSKCLLPAQCAVHEDMVASHRSADYPRCVDSKQATRTRATAVKVEIMPDGAVVIVVDIR